MTHCGCGYNVGDGVVVDGGGGVATAIVVGSFDVGGVVRVGVGHALVDGGGGTAVTDNPRVAVVLLVMFGRVGGGVGQSRLACRCRRLLLLGVVEEEPNEKEDKGDGDTHEHAPAHWGGVGPLVDHLDPLLKFPFPRRRLDIFRR